MNFDDLTLKMSGQSSKKHSDQFKHERIHFSNDNHQLNMKN